MTQAFHGSGVLQLGDRGLQGLLGNLFTLGIFTFFALSSFETRIEVIRRRNYGRTSQAGKRACFVMQKNEGTGVRHLG